MDAYLDEGCDESTVEMALYLRTVVLVSGCDLPIRACQPIRASRTLIVLLAATLPRRLTKAGTFGGADLSQLPVRLSCRLLVRTRVVLSSCSFDPSNQSNCYFKAK